MLQCIYKCYLSCTVIVGFVLGLFRHNRALFKSVLKHIQNLVYPWHSVPWHIPITKHIQTLRYIYNTLLNIFTKALSWPFDTVLNVCVCATSRLFRTPTYLDTLCFTHIQAYPQSYTYRGIFAQIGIQTYSGSWHNRFKVI